MNAAANEFTINQTLIIGFFSSVLANLCFLFVVLFFLKPKVEISKSICHYTDGEAPNTVEKWAIKVVNKSFFSAYDVFPILYVVKLIPANPSGYHKEYIQKIEFRRVTSYIGRRTFSDDKDGKHEYASWYITTENLKDLIIDGTTMLEFRISFKHQLTNLSNTQEKQYAIKNNVKDGKFVSGKKLDIE